MAARIRRVRDRRTISDEEAEPEVLAFISSRPNSDSFDVAMALGLDIVQAERICEGMVARGILRPVGRGEEG